MNETLRPGSQAPPKYWAFISYSHHDEVWARWLHRALETHRIPEAIARRLPRAEGGLSTDRIYPVFRDRDELAGAFDLEQRIQTALEESRFLIVVCSPGAVASRHVRQEIEYFEELGREPQVICLIVDGEPGASARPEAAARECLPEPVRTRRLPDGQLVPCEPIAADARRGKDGATNARLKVLATMLGVSFDDLKQRDRQRQIRRRLVAAAVAAAAAIVVGGSLLLGLDAGIDAPGGATVRRLADRYGVSVLRRLPPVEVVERKAGDLRTRLAERLKGATRDGWFLPSFIPDNGENDGVWIHSQIAYALLSPPESDPAALRQVAASLAKPFSSSLTFERGGVKYGWLARPDEVSPMSVPALWTALSLSIALRKNAFPTTDARAGALTQLATVQDALAPYHPEGAPGWNLFPNQRDPRQHNVYAATLALMALLEARRAGVPWQGSLDRRDRLTRETYDWLSAQFDPRQEPPGWTPGGDSLDTTSEGLSLQIYGRLLDAHAELGFPLDPRIGQQIPRHLAAVAGRALDFPSTSGEFVAAVSFDGGKPVNARESIGFPWYAWAADCAARWLRSREARDAATEDRVGVERALGHLVMTLGDEAATRASKGWTFEAAEMLMGLSAVTPPPAR